MATDKSPPDWEAIEREYRAGQFSIREIGRRYGVSDTAIRKQATEHGWQRALADKVREKAREKLVRIDGLQGGSQAPHANDEEIADQAANIQVEVHLTHRRDLKHLRDIGAILATRLAQHLNGETPDGPFLGTRESPGDLFEKLARVKARLIPLERQAHNLDAGGDESEPATKGDIRNVVGKLTREQRDSLRGIAETIVGGPEGDAEGA